MRLSTKTQTLGSYRAAGKKKGGVQRHYVGAREARADVLCLHSSAAPSGREYRAILEVPGINFLLKSEQEQLLITEIYQHFLAGLTYRIQVLMRVLPLNLAHHVQNLTPPAAPVREALFEQGGNGSPPPVDAETFLAVWRALASSHVDLLRRLAANRTLLERHFYLVIPADRDLAGEPGLLASLGLHVSKKKRKRRRAAEFERARQQLALRVDEITRQFSAMGLMCRRLPDKELMRLAHSCLMPRKAMRSPLPDAVLDGIDGDFTRLADVIAPASVLLQPNALCIEGEYNRVIVIDALPRQVALGFVRPLTEIDEPMEASFFYATNQQGPALRDLNRKRVQFRSTRNALRRTDSYQHPDIQVGEGDVEDLVPIVASGGDRMVDASIYILLRGATTRELDERTDRLMSLLGNMLVVARSAFFEQDLAFRSCQPECRDLLGRTLWLPGQSAAVATFMFISNTLIMRSGILEGITPSGEPVMLDWYSPEQRNPNRLVIAPSGSGKSYKCKIDLVRMFLKYLRGWNGRGDPPAQFFVIDPDGEWERLCNGLGGQYIQMGAGSPHHINPFALPKRRAHSAVRTGYASQGDPRADLLKEAVNQSHALLEIMLANRTAAGAGTLEADEKGLLDRCLFQMYRNAGITGDPSTHHREPPTMKDLYQVLDSGECGPDPSGLAQRLRRYVYGSLSGLFAGQTNVKLSSPVVCFFVPKEEEMRAIIYYLISRHVWNVSFGSNIPRMLIVDEMLNLYDSPEGARFLETLFQRSRKHYLSLTGIVQDPRKLRDGTIPTNCATVILMKQEAASLDIVCEMFKLSEQERRSLDVCGKGDALLLTNQNRILVHFEASDLEHRMASTDPAELGRWETEEEARRSSGAGGGAIQAEQATGEQGSSHEAGEVVVSNERWNGNTTAGDERSRAT